MTRQRLAATRIILAALAALGALLALALWWGSRPRYKRLRIGRYSLTPDDLAALATRVELRRQIALAQRIPQELLHG